MTVLIYATAVHQTECGHALAKGLARHGIEAELTRPMHYHPSDLAVIWGHRQHPIIANQKARGLPYLVMERGYFGDRFKHYSLGFNGLNGRANFFNADSPADRWTKHGFDLPPWKSGGECAIVMGQVVGDAALAHVDYQRWQREACVAAEAYKLPIYFRRHPHPKARTDGKMLRVPFSKLSLKEDLERAAVVITLNSNSAVDAVLAGVPAVTADVGAMARDVTGHKIGELFTPDRLQWARNLAYTQWLLSEIESGEAWEHLRKGFETLVPKRGPEVVVRPVQASSPA